MHLFSVLKCLYNYTKLTYHVSTKPDPLLWPINKILMFMKELFCAFNSTRMVLCRMGCLHYKEQMKVYIEKCVNWRSSGNFKGVFMIFTASIFIEALCWQLFSYETFLSNWLTPIMTKIASCKHFLNHTDFGKMTWKTTISRNSLLLPTLSNKCRITFAS